MRIKHLPWILSFGAVILFSSYTIMYPTGAPAAKTGSPGDGGICTECHGGTATTTAGQITSNIPASGYVPGQTYQITATNPLTGSGKYGFEVSPQNVAGTLLGTLVAGTGSQLVGGNKYVTHSNANTTTSSWTFSWTAPAAGTGTVTFYGAFAKGKPGPVTKSTLVVQEAASAPGAAGPITGPSTVCKNNTESYSIAAVSGATSYVWTAPSGATIASGQGTTSVTVNFGNSAATGNLSVYGTNASGNGAPSNKSVTVNSVPAQTSSIAGSNTACQGTSQVFSVTNVSGVSYSWTVPAGSVITAGQGTNSITVTIGGAAGDVQVVPSNSCGNGLASTFALSVSQLPAIPSTPEGPSQVNLQNVMTSDYSTSPGADSYVWQLTPAEAGSIQGNAESAQATWNPSYIGNAEITVKGVNGCGESNWSAAKTTQLLNTTGIDEEASGIRVISGDNQGIITFVMNRNIATAEVFILDASGRLIQQSTIPGEGTSQISHQLKSGVYIVVVNAGTVSLKKKILVL